jgi:hypothetical protein
MNESKTDTDFSQSTISDFGTEDIIISDEWASRYSLKYPTIKQPERSEWTCWLMGDYGKSQHGAIVYNPVKGQEPNWFHRKMQELCFGFQWRKL